MWSTVAAAVVGVLAAARLTRLIVYEAFPPAVWLRTRLAGRGRWRDLVGCHYCTAPYVTAVVLGAGWAVGWSLWWWVPTVWLAASYVAAMVVSWDGS
jgi:hypothetical protein